MHYLQLFFRGRANPVSVPVHAADGEHFLEYLTDRTERTPFITLDSVVDHQIWISGTTLQMARFLLEMGAPPFSSADISPSRQFPKDESDEPELLDIQWSVTFWIHGRPEPLEVSDVHGGDWVEIYTSLDCGEQFIVITDEDGEEVVVRVEDIDMICGLESRRYSTDQLEAISGLISYKA